MLIRKAQLDGLLQFGQQQMGHTHIVDLLLDRKANPSLPDENGQTPLSVAKEKGHDDVIDVLRAMTGLQL